LEVIMSSEREKMLSGGLYDAADGELAASRRRARDLLCRLNRSRDGEQELRQQLYAALFGSTGRNVCIEPPFFCDYGSNIYLGDRVFFNFNCVILDPAEVHIGNDVLLGPAVQIYTATHPLDWRVRRQWLESARPVVIGSDVWIGGGAILCPGVRIGDRAVVGAGAVVTKDVPAGVFAAGNPCRIIRELPQAEEDS
jgi:maltose O-acetyltransferase